MVKPLRHDEPFEARELLINARQRHDVVLRDRLRAMMVAKYGNMNRAAKAAGVSRQAVSDFLHDTRPVRPVNVDEWLERLKIPLAEFWE